jgi:hypothetical protein
MSGSEIWDRIKGNVPPHDESHESHNLQLQHRKRERAASGEWLNSDLVFVFNGPKARASTLKSGIERLLGQDERSKDSMAEQVLNRNELTMGLAKADILMDQIAEQSEHVEDERLKGLTKSLRGQLDRLITCVNE